MFLTEIFSRTVVYTMLEDNSQQLQLVVTYPGRFQPWHMGHTTVFRSIQAKFGRDSCFVVTSNKTELPKSPFDFNDKVKFMIAAGVHADRIIEAKNPYGLPENFDPSKTIFIVAVGEPDKERLAAGSTKKDGTDSYYQPFKSLDSCSPADKHGYVIIVGEKHKEIQIGNQNYDVSHGTEVRALWDQIRKNPKKRTQFLEQMYGHDDSEIGMILDKIPSGVSISESIDVRDVELIRKARIAHPYAENDAEALALYTNDQEEDHYEQLSDENDEEEQMIDRLQSLELDLDRKVSKLQNQIDSLKGKVSESAGVGVIANSKQKNDPRFMMSLTKDVRPDTMKKELKAFFPTKYPKSKNK